MGLIPDGIPAAFFERRLLPEIIADNGGFENWKIAIENDPNSLFNQQILTISFENDFDYTRLLHILKTDEKDPKKKSFKLKQHTYAFCHPTELFFDGQGTSFQACYMQRCFDLVLGSMENIMNKSC